MQIREFIPKEFVAWARSLSFEHIRQFDLIRQVARAEATTKLIVIGALTVVIPIAGKNLLTGDAARYRPYLGIAASLTLAVAAAATSDTIRYRRYADRGWEVAAETDIEAAEDLVQTATERKYELHSAPRSEKVTVEQLAAPEVIPEPQVENVGQTVARSKLPVLVVGGTGVGKTSFLERVIYEAHNEFSQARIIFFDGKPVDDRPMLGIKTQRDSLYYSVAHYSEIPRFYEDMDKIGSQMADARRSQKSQKMFAIVDELNNAITKAKKYRLHEASKPQKERDSFNYEQGLKIGNDLIISQGREKNCVGIATTHSATVEAMGQDMAMRANQGFVVLAAPDSFDNLEIILSGVGAKLIQNPRTLERLNQQYEAHKNLLLQGYFALTNVGGDWRLVRLPDYSQPLPMIWRGDSEPEDSVEDEPVDRQAPLPYTEPQQSFPKDWLDSPIREEERDRVGYLCYQRQVQNRGEIALRVWGVAKGGSRYYQQAMERIDEILR